MQIARRIVLALLAVVAWILADLWLGRDLLPWAPQLQHLAFRSVVFPLEWLTEDSGIRLQIAMGIAALIGAAGLALRKTFFGRVVWQLGAVALTGGLVFVGVLGLLMERALAGGILVALATRVLLVPRLGIDPLGTRAAPLDSTGRRALAALLVMAGGGALYWLYSVFMTFGEGYALLQWLGGLLRDGGAPFLGVWSGVVALATVAGGFALRRSTPSPPTVAVPIVVGLVAAVALRSLFGTHGPIWTGVLAVPLGVIFIELLAPSLALHEPERAFIPSTWPRRVLLPALIGGVLVAHSYTARILACPASGELPFLRKVATTTEIFRIEPGSDGRLALSGREGRAVRWLNPETGELGTFAAGPVAAPLPDGVPADGSMAGNPEELVWSEADGAWWATIVPMDPWQFMPQNTPPGFAINNVLVRIDPSSSSADHAQGFPGMCWINTLHAQPDGLWIGCEDRAGVVRVKDGSVVQQFGPEEMGDVQDIAFSPKGDRLWTISLWLKPNLTEIRRDDFSIAAQASIGGTHYHLAHDPATNRLFVSSWYGSRLRIVSGGKLDRLGSLPLGFGGRAVELDAERRLLLASSTYDGLLRVCDPDALEVKAALPVGGHVKAIAIDEDLGRAWFWSQCGLYELDLDGLVEWLGRDG